MEVNINSNHKAKLDKTSFNPDDDDEETWQDLAEKFEQLVSWCITGDRTSLHNALSRDKKKLYLSLINPWAKDTKTGYVVYEFATIKRNLDILDCLMTFKPNKSAFGNAIEIAIENDESDFVEELFDGFKFWVPYRQCYDFNNKRWNEKYLFLALKHNSKKTLEMMKNHSGFRIKNLRTEESQGFRAIHLCSIEGLIDQVKWLVDNDIDINCASDNVEALGLTALHFAAKNGHFKLVEYLVDQGANLFNIDEKGPSPKKLLESTLEGITNEEEKKQKQEILEYLDSKMSEALQNFSINYTATFATSRLTKSLYEFQSKENLYRKAFAKLVNLCIIGDERISSLDHWLSCPLNNEDEEWQMIKPCLFLKHNVEDLNSGYRPIDFAAFKGHLRVIRCLIEHGAQPDAQKAKHFTHRALDVAIIKGHKEIVQCLIEHGAYFKDRLYFALENDQMDIAKILMKGFGHDKADLDYINENGFNALHLAVKLNRLDFVQILITRGADPNKKSGCEGHGRTALHFAAENLNQEIIEYLINNGADISIKDINRFTPLTLVKKGIKTNFTNSDHEVQEVNATEDLQLKDRIMKFLSSKMKQHEDTSEHSGEDGPPAAKRRKIDNAHCSKDDSNHMVNPLIESFMNRSMPFEAKIGCLIAINALISEDDTTCHFLTKKDVIDEIGIVANQIIFKVGKQPDKNLDVIAKILSMVNLTDEGKKLIQDIRMPHSALVRLKNEMRREESDLNPGNFAFDSDLCRKVKT